MYVPTQEIHANLDSDEFLFDFHVHTTFSDGSLSPQERVQWYMSQGIHGAAFSDHNNANGAKIAAEYVEKNNLNFTVLIAQEYTYYSNDIHLNIYGIKETILPLEENVFYRSTGFQLNITDMIKYVKDNNGYVTVNHYESIGSGPYTYEELRDWGVDGFEIVNEGGERALTIREFCIENDLICIAGTDSHANQEINTFIRLRVEDPTNISVHSVFGALAKNEHKVVAVRKVYQPFEAEYFGCVLRYFICLDSNQLLSWWIWSMASFALLIVGLKLIFSKLSEKGKSTAN